MCSWCPIQKMYGEILTQSHNRDSCSKHKTWIQGSGSIGDLPARRDRALVRDDLPVAGPDELDRLRSPDASIARIAGRPKPVILRSSSGSR